MIPLLLLPLLTKLAESGLNLIGNAVLNKGKDLVEKELGVSLDDATKTEAGLIQLQQLQNDHEELLLKLAVENRQIDLDYYKVDASDRDSARDRETAVASTDGSWLAQNIVPVLALFIVIGGGLGIYFSTDEGPRSAFIVMVTAVTAYYFGASKGKDRQEQAIQHLAATKSATAAPSSASGESK